MEAAITPLRPVWVVYHIDPNGDDSFFVIDDEAELKDFLTAIINHEMAAWKNGFENLIDRCEYAGLVRYMEAGRILDAWAMFSLINAELYDDHRWKCEGQLSRYTMQKVSRISTTEDFLDLWENPAQDRFNFAQPAVTKLEHVQGELSYHVERLKSIVRTQLRNTGNVEEDCQQLCLLNRLERLGRCVNGIEPADLK